MKLRLASLALLAFFLASCGGQKPVTINTIRPADIGINPAIETILIVDRTKPSDENKWLNIGEAILTGEGIEGDKAAAQAVVNSLKNQLQISPRFNVLVASERLEGNSFSAAFPEPLNWSTQQNLLNRYKADALVCVEIVDSDFIITEGKRKVKRTVGTGDNQKTIEVDEWYAEGVGNIKIGLRMYDPANKEIIDQQLLDQTNTWQGAADSKAGAIAALINRNSATRELANMVGHDYAYKIAPMPVQLRRIFYTKAKDFPPLEEGARLAEVNDWQSAIAVWERAIPSAEPKEAGRMSYNIAVAYEVLGDLKESERWAQQSYAKYGNKTARTYATQIQRRIVETQVLESQMK